MRALGCGQTAVTGLLKEPNNSGEEDCLESIGSGSGWNDKPCNTEQRFVCSKAICTGKKVEFT